MIIIIDVQNPDDWYHVKVQDIMNRKGGGIIGKYYKGSLMKALTTLYPNVAWDVSKGKYNEGKSQTLLFKMVQDLFSGTEVLMNYRHPDLLFSHSGARMELDILIKIILVYLTDIYIPTLSLAFEHQGIQHYHHHYNIGSSIISKKRDQEKQIACKKNNITLIEIPYWWDSKKETLIATIHKHRTDLFIDPGKGKPIEINYKPYYF
jgi:hypothetical protein